jgi:hypothetical protein
VVRGGFSKASVNCAWIRGYSEAIQQVEEQGYYAFDNLSITKHRHMFAYQSRVVRALEFRNRTAGVASGEKVGKLRFRRYCGPLSPVRFHRETSRIAALFRDFRQKCGANSLVFGLCGGEGGIRTPGTLPGTPVFKTGAINHSATSPQQLRLLVYQRCQSLSRGGTLGADFERSCARARRGCLLFSGVSRQ